MREHHGVVFLWAVCACLALAQLADGAAAASGEKTAPGTQPTTLPARVDLATILAEANVLIGVKGRNGVAKTLNADPVFREMLRWREERLKRVQELIAGAPPGMRIECLTVDALYPRPSGVSEKDCVLLHYIDPLGSRYGQNFLALLSEEVDEEVKWRFIRQLCLPLISRQQPPEDCKPEWFVADVVVIGYFDGKLWKYGGWRNMSLIPEEATGVRELRGLCTFLSFFVKNGFDGSRYCCDDGSVFDRYKEFMNKESRR
jgi:hypothetical protein